MDKNCYEIVDCDDKGDHYEDIKTKESWKPFLRQLVIASGVWTLVFTYGLLVGTPTVLVQYIRKEANSTSAVSKEMASWLSSSFGFSAIPWVIAMPVIIKLYGIKKIFFFVTLNTTVGLVIFVTSQSTTQVLISNIIQGPLTASIVTLSFQVLTEYTSPKYRGFILTISAASFFWGIWVANAIGTFFYWKNVGIVGFMCMTYNLATIFIWCESPYWLARRGRCEECTKVLYWLKGINKESRKELRTLIKKQMDRSTNRTQNENQANKYVLSIHKTLLSKEIYKPLLISLLVMELYYISGKFVCSVYAIDVFMRISGESFAYKGMLILDGVTVFSMYIGCGLTKLLKRRILLFTATLLCILFLFLMALYLYLIKLEILVENNYISLGLLSAYSLSVCCGPTLMANAICAELIPLKARSTSFCLNALCSKITVSIFIKLAPYIFDLCGMHGTFLFYAIGTSVNLLLLYLYMPETKDKNLQEIVDSLNVSQKNTEEVELFNINKIEEPLVEKENCRK